MKIAKRIGLVILVYIGIVIAFESTIGFFQPANQSTLVITTTNESGVSKDRVIARLASNRQLYVAANHWPRAWYKQALDHPEVQVDLDGKKNNYVAVPVEGSERDRVDVENSLPLPFRILTGFPPRHFLRLDPR